MADRVEGEHEQGDTAASDIITKDCSEQASGNGDTDVAMTTDEADVGADNGHKMELQTNDETERKIMTQLEYYFGSFNIKKDKFLAEQIANNTDGWVTLDTMLKFNRLSRLSEDKQVIASAVRKFNSDVVEVNEDGTSIRRVPANPAPDSLDALKKESAFRTVYVKGFPTETTTMNDVLDFIETYGKTDNVILRKYQDKTLKKWVFKGSVFVVFSTVEDMDKFLALDEVKFEDHALERLSQKDYIARKQKKRADAKLQSKLKKFNKDIIPLPSGCVLGLAGLGDGVVGKGLRTALEELKWPVEFVEHNPGEKEAFVRLKGEASAATVFEGLGEDKTVKIADVDVDVTVITGEDEQRVLKKMELGKQTRINTKRGKGGNKRKHPGDERYSKKRRE